ncbi:hypothetical protein [Paracoccus saliphilus]|uniref:Uncharacterized protein n=1 Tax=Paracoccus saliphilus TaxID=405559 RepID=A0AA46A5T1_9RHOB|nr:hypothetical protein [Paracoccus saliphilus]WCR04561.1 hypothetical protein JHX88_07540 [Paracoccus saliphilus]SIS86822.1 hypothetical protein SAMN05421772_10718 [Paracoccus saliphilus]
MEYSFHIEGSYHPETIPMDRLAEYLHALAQLLGEKPNVHFKEVTEGCVALHALVDSPAQTRVAGRIEAANSPAPPKDIVNSVETLDQMLRKDHATGSLRDGRDRVVIPFPGIEKQLPPVFGPIKQKGSLTGQVVRVGGTGDTIPVHLRDGQTPLTGLYTSEEAARQLAQHYLGGIVRVHGTGTWFRESNGVWRLDRFKIDSFEVLDDTPLSDVVARLRDVGGSKWGEVPDPVAALLAERNGDGETH